MSVSSGRVQDKHRPNGEPWLAYTTSIACDLAAFACSLSKRVVGVEFSAFRFQACFSGRFCSGLLAFARLSAPVARVHLLT